MQRTIWLEASLHSRLHRSAVVSFVERIKLPSSDQTMMPLKMGPLYNIVIFPCYSGFLSGGTVVLVDEEQ